ncbi:HAD-IA family hydrolase [Streptomyces sp. NPDC047525]|uniref:HAD family hydrolase n=1 Tax=Streptomyces sp. NPDC047525 TaxID=3155264 RepID=UPI0033E533FB
MSLALKVALFDLDATLTDHAAAFDLWAEEFAETTGFPLQWILQAEERHAGARHEFFKEIKETFGAQTSIAALHATYRQRSAEMVPHRPDVCAALEELVAGGWALGVVTNGAPDAQRTKLEVARLRRYFGSVVISGEIGVRKPDRALFQLALDELQADEDAWSVMVGDGLATDIEGGLRAGLHTVWVAAGRSRRPGDPTPTHTVDNVVEACTWLHANAPNTAPVTELAL